MKKTFESRIGADEWISLIFFRAENITSNTDENTTFV